MIRADQSREKLVRIVTPALAVALVGWTLTSIVLVFFLLKGQDTKYILLPPEQGDGVPAIAVSDPLSQERVALWAMQVSERLFDFSHANSAAHFRSMRIYFTPQGMLQFRQALVESNWLQQVESRRAVLRGEVSRNLRVTFASDDHWELDGGIRLALDQPGYDLAKDNKRLVLRIVRRDPAAPTEPPWSPFPATNYLGLKIDRIFVSE